jgi:hypothetical protein
MSDSTPAPRKDSLGTSRQKAKKEKKEKRKSACSEMEDKVPSKCGGNVLAA